MTEKEILKIKQVKKDIKEYNQSRPIQLELFELDDQNKGKYSNTVELYDMIPKYYFGGVERDKGKSVDALPILQRDFSDRSKDYKLAIVPAALIDRKSGKTIHYYPSQREELVEDAIRRLAVTKKSGIYLDKQDVAVKFTLYELQQELKRMGHGYSVVEIKEAIEICNRAIITITDKEGNEAVIGSAIFPFVGMESKEDIGGKGRVVVMFHPLVTRSIDDNTYRLINYEKLMSYKMTLSRRLHKRISHNFIQASATNPYRIKMSTLVRDSGMKEYARNSDTLKQVNACLDEMKAANTISKYEINKEFEGRKLIDVTFDLYASDDFINEIKKANSLKNEKHKIDNSPEFLKKAAELEKELKDPVYELTMVVIKSIMSKVHNNYNYDVIVDALKAAKGYIQGKTNTDLAPMAVVKTAIREGWKPPYAKKLLVQEERKEKIIAKEREKKPLTAKDKELWKKIQLRMRKEYGEENYNKWLSKLDLHSYNPKCEVEMSAPSKMIRDWIKREYWGYKDGWGKKSIKEIWLEEDNKLDDKNIHIIFVEKSESKNS